jgi:hypothetical protein
MLSVVVTADHFWLAGIVAAILLAAVLLAQTAAGRLRCGLPQYGPISQQVDVRSSR